jgi:hypothetical protein
VKLTGNKIKGWFSGPSPYSFHFVVGLQKMVKQKYKNVPRKTIHQTENKYLEFVLNISPVSLPTVVKQKCKEFVKVTF